MHSAFCAALAVLLGAAAASAESREFSRTSLRIDLPIEWSSADPRQSEGRINGGGAELFVESDRATVELWRRRD